MHTMAWRCTVLYTDKGRGHVQKRMRVSMRVHVQYIDKLTVRITVMTLYRGLPILHGWRVYTTIRAVAFARWAAPGCFVVVAQSLARRLVSLVQ